MGEAKTKEPSKNKILENKDRITEENKDKFHLKKSSKIEKPKEASKSSLEKKQTLNKQSESFDKSKSKQEGLEASVSKTAKSEPQQKIEEQNKKIEVTTKIQPAKSKKRPNLKKYN